MTTPKKRFYATAVLAVLAILVLAGIGLSRRHKAKLPGEDIVVPANVPPTWASVRGSPGHLKHLADKPTDKPAPECRDCHDVTDGKFAHLDETTACGKCHEGELKRTHGGKEATDQTSCTKCHAFGAKPAPACLDCHAEPQGSRKAIGVHITKDAPCQTCHAPHRPPPLAQRDCSKCHTKIKASHGPQHVKSDGDQNSGFVAGATGSPTCTDCHAPHTKAVFATSTCSVCHTNAPKGPKPSGHTACTVCHAPHDFVKPTPAACAACHIDRRGAAGIAAHSQCTTCHPAHNTPAPRTVCTNCHADQQTMAAAIVPQHAGCNSCHSPHDPKAARAASCAKCHGDITPKHSGGKADLCVNCHQPHPKKAAGRAQSATWERSASASVAACSSCHKAAKTDKGFHARGPTCTSCHLPHSFAIGEAGAALCQKCHAGQSQLIATNAATNKGHSDCRQCHGIAHTPMQMKNACGSCHKPQGATALAGHSNCRICHDPHSGRVKAAATSCKSCHAKEGASAHGVRVKAQNPADPNGSCRMCHRQHGPGGPETPPACRTCHNRGTLPWLHRAGTGTDGHASCSTCHWAHDPASSARIDRATCTSCHTDKKDHQPEAKVCTGCHFFRR